MIHLQMPRVSNYYKTILYVRFTLKVMPIRKFFDPSVLTKAVPNAQNLVPGRCGRNFGVDRLTI
jgi:hypothetical protein